MSERLQVDDLEYELRRSSRRKTVGVTVDRDGDLILHAPEDCPIETIERVARDKELWVYTKLALKNRLQLPSKPKEYVSGEGFSYLGRSYQLRLVDHEQAAPLRLYRGRFELRSRDAAHGRRHFEAWYRVHGRAWIGQRVEDWSARVGAQPTGISVQRLGNRWGSCTREGRLNFHWRTIMLPPSIVDYVIVHELAHLLEPLHSPAFWERVDRALPDYQQRIRWLAENGSRFDL